MYKLPKVIQVYDFYDDKNEKKQRKRTTKLIVPKNHAMCVIKHRSIFNIFDDKYIEKGNFLLVLAKLLGDPLADTRLLYIFIKQQKNLP